MSQYHFITCACGADNRVRTQQAGSTIRCTGCDQPLSVPQLRALVRLPKADDPAPVAGRQPWSLGRGIAFSAALGVLLLSLAVTTTYGVRRAALDERRPPPIDPRFNQDFQKMDPLQAWTLWEDARERAILRPMTPGYIVNRRVRGIYWRIMMVAGMIGLLSLLALLIIYFYNRTVFESRPGSSTT